MVLAICKVNQGLPCQKENKCSKQQCFKVKKHLNMTVSKKLIVKFNEIQKNKMEKKIRNTEKK